MDSSSASGSRPGLASLFSDAARLALLLLGLIVTVGVVSRAAWRSVIVDDVLLVAELMLVVILAPLALVTARREHIAVGVFTERAGVGVRRLLGILESVVGLAFFGILLAAYLRMFSSSWTSGEIYESELKIPFWPGHGFAVLCLLLVVWRLGVQLLRRGDDVQVERAED